MHACTHSNIHTHTHTYTRMHTHTHRHTHTYTRMHACTHSNTHTHRHTHTGTHTQAHTHAHTHSNTHTPLCMCESVRTQADAVSKDPPGGYVNVNDQAHSGGVQTADVRPGSFGLTVARCGGCPSFSYMFLYSILLLGCL